MGRLRRSRAVWRRGAPYAPRRASDLHDGCTGGGATSGRHNRRPRARFRLSRVALHQLAESVLRSLRPGRGRSAARRDDRQRGRGRHLRLESRRGVQLTPCRLLVDQRRSLQADLRPGPAPVLDHDSHKRWPLPRVLLERPGLHLRHRLQDADALRSPCPSGRADDLVGGVLSAGVVGHRHFHPCGTRPSAAGPRAAPRDQVQLLPQAVPGLRARCDHSGSDSGGRHPLVLRQSPHRRCGARGRTDSRRRAAGHRAVERAHSPDGRARAGERRRHDLDQPGDRSGRQHLRGGRAHRDEQARFVRVRASRHADAGRRLSGDRAPAAAEFRRRRPHRHRALHDCGGACPRGRQDGDPDRAAGDAAARHRSGDRRSGSWRPPGVAPVRPARRGDRIVDGRADRGSDQPAHPRNPPHRARGLRRPDCRPLGR